MHACASRLHVQAHPGAQPPQASRVNAGEADADMKAGTHINPQKQRHGLTRLWHAAGYSWQGLVAGWKEPAFRLEALLAMVLLPLSFWLGQGWVEVGLLAGSVMLVLIVEILNTAIEAVVDRFGPHWHELAGKAKDMGSAAVLLALLLAGGIWLAALWDRFG